MDSLRDVTFWPPSFSVEVQCVLKHKSKMTDDCRVFNFSGILYTGPKIFLHVNHMIIMFSSSSKSLVFKIFVPTKTQSQDFQIPPV